MAEVSPITEHAGHLGGIELHLVELLARLLDREPIADVGGIGAPHGVHLVEKRRGLEHLGALVRQEPPRHGGAAERLALDHPPLDFARSRFHDPEGAVTFAFSAAT